MLVLSVLHISSSIMLYLRGHGSTLNTSPGQVNTVYGEVEDTVQWSSQMYVLRIEKYPSAGLPTKPCYDFYFLDSQVWSSGQNIM